MTKKTTKNRKQEREFKETLSELKNEFGNVINDYDIIDELALAGIDDFDDYYG